VKQSSLFLKHHTNCAQS